MYINTALKIQKGVILIYKKNDIDHTRRLGRYIYLYSYNTNVMCVICTCIYNEHTNALTIQDVVPAVRL